MSDQAPPPPLKGVRVLDFTRWLAGPFATSMLGDMGADVIKVERPGRGDDTRQADRLYSPGMGSYFLGLNRSKRSIALDITQPRGREVARAMAAQCDVVVENFRPGVMARNGLDYDDLRPLNERLVYCAISSFGPDGPLRDKPGMDLVIQAMGGVMGLTGPIGGPPMRVGVPIADFLGAYQTVVGVLLGLQARAASGLGQRVDVSLLDGQVSVLANFVAGYARTASPNGPVGNTHPQLVPYEVFETQDGRMVIACLTEKFWQGLCHVLQLDELLSDPRFTMNVDRVAHREELIPIIAAAVREQRSADLTAALDAMDVPSAPILSFGEVLAHPQVLHNAMVVDLQTERTGAYKAVGIPVKLRANPGQISRAAPVLGEHTEEILRELGVTENAIRDLIASGVAAGMAP